MMNRETLRHLVDIVWMESHEDESVPSTEWADKMIDRALRERPPVYQMPEWKRKVCEQILSQPLDDGSYVDHC